MKRYGHFRAHNERWSEAEMLWSEIALENWSLFFVAGRSLTVLDSPELLAMSFFRPFLHIDSSYRYGWLSEFAVSGNVPSFVALCFFGQCNTGRYMTDKQARVLAYAALIVVQYTDVPLNGWVVYKMPLYFAITSIFQWFITWDYYVIGLCCFNSVPQNLYLVLKSWVSNLMAKGHCCGFVRWPHVDKSQ
jgi:hypothetical protein